MQSSVWSDDSKGWLHKPLLFPILSQNGKLQVITLASTFDPDYLNLLNVLHCLVVC